MTRFWQRGAGERSCILTGEAFHEVRRVTTPSMPFRRQVLVNTFSSTLANAWSMLVTLVALPVTLGGLGSELFGVWVLITTFSAANGWFSLADLGIGITTTRRIADLDAVGDRDGIRRTVSASAAALAALGLLGGGLLATIGAVGLPTVFGVPSSAVHQAQIALVIYSLQVLVDMVVYSTQASLDGLNRVDVSRVVEVVRRTLAGLGTGAAALITASLIAVAAASLLASLIALVGAAGLLRRQLGAGAARPRPGEVRSLFREGRGAALLRPLGVIQRTMDRMLVGVLLGPSAVTLVEVATQLQAAADAVLASSINAVVPASSWLARTRGRKALAELAERGTKYSLLLTAPVIVAVATLSAPLIDLWLGPEFSQAASLTSIAVLNVAIAAPVALGSQMLLGTGHANSITRAAALALVVNLVASIVLVGVVGVVGVFIGTILGALLLLPLLGIPFLQLTGLTGFEFARRAVWPVVLPTLGQVVVSLVIVSLGWSSWLTLVAGGGLGLVTYLVSVRLFSVDPGEIDRLRAEARSPSG